MEKEPLPIYKLPMEAPPLSDLSDFPEFAYVSKYMSEGVKFPLPPPKYSYNKLPRTLLKPNFDSFPNENIDKRTVDSRDLILNVAKQMFETPSLRLPFAFETEAALQADTKKAAHAFRAKRLKLLQPAFVAIRRHAGWAEIGGADGAIAWRRAKESHTGKTASHNSLTPFLGAVLTQKEHRETLLAGVDAAVARQSIDLKRRALNKPLDADYVIVGSGAHAQILATAGF
jgi:hypothetical protein